MRNHPPAPAPRSAKRVVTPEDPSPGARRWPPLCREPALPIPGSGDGEVASLRGGEAAERLPGVPDVLHRLVPAALPVPTCRQPPLCHRHHAAARARLKLYPPRINAGVGKGPSTVAQDEGGGGAGEGKVPKNTWG